MTTRLPAGRSWKIKGFWRPVMVMPVREDLGANDAVADIFVCHTRDAAHDAGIALKPYH